MSLQEITPVRLRARILGQNHKLSSAIINFYDKFFRLWLVNISACYAMTYILYSDRLQKYFAKFAELVYICLL